MATQEIKIPTMRLEIPKSSQYEFMGIKLFKVRFGKMEYRDIEQNLSEVYKTELVILAQLMGMDRRIAEGMKKKALAELITPYISFEA